MFPFNRDVFRSPEATVLERLIIFTTSVSGNTLIVAGSPTLAFACASTITVPASKSAFGEAVSADT